MKKRDVWIRVGGILLATMLLYPLSMGPVGVLFVRMHIREDGPVERAILTLYSPLNKLADVSPAFGRATDAYCMWWMRVAGASLVIRIDETAE